MPTLTGSNLTTWRTTPYSLGLYAFLYAPATVFAARVNMASVTYPLSSITFDTVTTGAYTDIVDGMTLLLGSSAGASDLGRVRVRGSATTTVINIDRASRGIRDGELNVSDNAYITVLNWRPIWSIPPRIAEDGTTYKYTDVAFSAAAAQPPVANAGPDVLFVVDDIGDTAFVSFGQTNSFKTDDDASGTLTYSWSFPDGQTSTLSTPGVTLTAPTVGYTRLTVTDSLGVSHTAYALTAVVHKGHANLLKNWQITSHRHTREGQEITLRVADSIPETTYPNGTELLIAQEEQYGSSQGSVAGLSNREHMVFAGWLRSEDNEMTASRRGLLGRTTISAVDSAGRLKMLPGFPQVIENETSPTTWNQMDGANIDRYVHYLLHWHSNVLTRADFTWSGQWYTYGVQTLGSDGQSLYEQADGRTQAIAHKLTCDKYGRLKMVTDPQLNDLRTSTVIVALNDSDWNGYRYTYTHVPRTHWNWGEAIVTSIATASSGTDVETVFCVAPGAAPGQGVSAQTSGQQVVVNQNELNAREGHRYAARMNQTFGNIELTLTRQGDAWIDPALMEWVQWGVDSDTDTPRGRTWATTTRFLPLEVNYDYDPQRGTRRIRLTLEQEVIGTPAQSYFPPDESTNGGLPDSGIPDITIISPAIVPRTVFPLWTGTDQVPLTIFAVEAKGNGVARGTGISDGSITWTDIETSTITGSGRWASSDPYDYQRFFVLTTTGIFRTNNKLTATPTWSQSATGADIFGASGRYGHLLLMSHNLKGWMLVPSGTYVAVTFDYGATWTQTDLYGGTGAYMTDPDYIPPRAMRVVIGNHNSATHGELWAVLPYDAPFDNGAPTLFKSEDWGLTWSVALQLEGEGALYLGTSLYAPYRRDATTANTSGSGHKLYWMGGTNDSFGGGSSFHRTVVTSSGTEAFDETLPTVPIGSPDPWAFQLGGNDLSAYTRIPSHIRNYHVHPSNGDLVTTIVSDVDYSIGSGEVALALSSDGGATWTISNKLTGLAGFPNLNGFSMHRRFFIVWKGWTSATYLPTGYYYSLGAGYLKVTADNGDTWFGNSPPSFADGAVAYAEADLSAFQ